MTEEKNSGRRYALRQEEDLGGLKRFLRAAVVRQVQPLTYKEVEAKLGIPKGEIDRLREEADGDRNYSKFEIYELFDYLTKLGVDVDIHLWSK